MLGDSKKLISSVFGKKDNIIKSTSQVGTELSGDKKNNSDPKIVRGVPTDLIKEKYGNPQFMNGKVIYFDPITRAKKTTEEVEAEIRLELEKLKPFQQMEDKLLKARIIATFVMTFDIFLKFAYLEYSRFASIEVKHTYISFLALRPVLIVGLMFYNFMLTSCAFMTDYKRRKKMFKDDSGFQP